MAKQTIGIGTTANDGTGDNLRVAGAKINDNFTELYESKRHGIYDYDNTLTAQSLTGGTPIYLLNDGAGANTNLTYKLNTVSNIFNTTTNAFDFSGLALGDKVDIRVDVDITTTTANQVINLVLELGIGATPYEIKLISEKQFKTASLHSHLTESSFIYLGNNLTKNNPAKIKISSPDNATIKVNGWVIVAHKQLL